MLGAVEAGANGAENGFIISTAAVCGAKGRMTMQGRQTPTVVAALLAGIVAFSMTGSPAAAQDQRFTVYGEANEGQIERVAFADLDLAGAGGQARLHHRVDAAIERVCDLDLGRDGLQDRGYYACAGNAWGNAAPQIAEAVATGKTGLGAAIVVLGR